MDKGKKLNLLLCLLLLVLLSFALFSCGEVSSSQTGEKTQESGAYSEGESEDASESGSPTEEETIDLPQYLGEHSLALPQKESACSDFTVVIDAGHGQRDPGNMAFEYKESDINLSLSLRLAFLLEEMGYRVLLTRDDDHAMLGEDPNYDTDKEAEARRKWAATQGADLYISIHCNAADDENARGTRMFYNTRPITSFSGRALASCYRDALNSEFSAEIAAMTNPEVKSNHVNGMEEDIYIVLQDVKLPAVLIEIGFMTNEEDLSLLLNGDYLWEYAHALAIGSDQVRKTVLLSEEQ